MGRTKGKQEALDATTAERFKTRLAQARLAQNLTLDRVAEVVGCSESLLSKIERGRSYPSLPTLVRLVKALNISMGWLFENREDDELFVRKPVSPERPTQP